VGNGKHVDPRINTLRDHVFPLIGAKPVNQVGTPDVLDVLTRIWTSNPETARRAIWDCALRSCSIGRVPQGIAPGDNPVELVGDALPRHRQDPNHHAALPYPEVSRFVVRLRASNAEPISKLAFEFLILTAARTNEVRKARWSEINFATQTWTIPGNDPTGRRMKSGEPVAPLSLRCMEISTGREAAGAGQRTFSPGHTTSPPDVREPPPRCTRRPRLR